MDQNPYAPPSTSTPVVDVLSGSREDLRSIATYQRGIIFCILFYIAGMISRAILPEQIWALVALGIIAAAIVGAVFVFLLSTKVYGTALGILLGILCLIPLLGILILLIVNGKATSVLRKNGIRVGFFGVNPAHI